METAKPRSFWRRAPTRFRRRAPGVVAPLRRALLPLCLLLLLLRPGSTLADDELDYGLEQRSVKSVEIAGNQSFDEGRLKDLLPFGEPKWYTPLRSSHYTSDLLMLGVEGVRAFYRRQGFHEVQVDGEVVDRDSRVGDRIRLTIVEGPRTLVGKVVFRGDSPLKEEELRRALVHGEGKPAPYLEAEYGRDVYSLRAAHLARGYLGCRIFLDIQPREQKRDLYFTVNAGPAYTVTEIRVEGNREVRESLIRREFRMHSGEVFNLDRIVSTEADLLETGWFRDVSFNPAELDTTVGTCALVLNVVERPSGFYEVGIGAGDRDQLRLSAAWGEGNLLGSGKGLQARIHLLWGFDDIVGLPNRRIVFDHREELTYRHRRFLGTRYSLLLSGFFDRESRGASGVAIERLGVLASTTLWRKRTRSLGVELSSELIRKVVLRQVREESDLTDEEFKSIADAAGSTNTNAILFIFTRDTRDNIFSPRHGSVRQALWTTAGGPFFGDNHFHKLLTTWTNFFALGRESIFAMRMQAGWSAAYGESAERGPLGVPLENRFFAGGQRSVRGYRENSLGPRFTAADEELVLDDRFLLNHPAAGGNALVLANAEMRLPMPVLSRWGFGLIFFADGGNVWEDWSKVRIGGFRLTSQPDGADATTIFDWRTSVGFGLLYHTPVGPLRLEYGLPLKRARLFDEEGNSQVDPHHLWHFSLGFAF